MVMSLMRACCSACLAGCRPLAGRWWGGRWCGGGVQGGSVLCTGVRQALHCMQQPLSRHLVSEVLTTSTPRTPYWLRSSGVLQPDSGARALPGRVITPGAALTMWRGARAGCRGPGAAGAATRTPAWAAGPGPARAAAGRRPRTRSARTRPGRPSFPGLPPPPRAGPARGRPGQRPHRRPGPREADQQQHHRGQQQHREAAKAEGQGQVGAVSRGLTTHRHLIVFESFGNRICEFWL
jgi:hypothetical protein